MADLTHIVPLVGVAVTKTLPKVMKFSLIVLPDREMPLERTS